MSPRRIPERLQVWIDARTRHHLSHAQVQMARELGMNPKKFGRLDNHPQEPWKVPLPQFIEHLPHAIRHATSGCRRVDRGSGPRGRGQAGAEAREEASAHG